MTKKGVMGKEWRDAGGALDYSASPMLDNLLQDGHKRRNERLDGRDCFAALKLKTEHHARDTSVQGKASKYALVDSE